MVFVPEDRNISGGSSSFRRRFFDMMISTLDGGYLTALNNYYRALSQRNPGVEAERAGGGGGGIRAGDGGECAADRAAAPDLCEAD